MIRPKKEQKMEKSNTENTEIAPKTGVRNAKKWEASPFIEPLVIKTRGKKMTVARGSTIVDLDTGEIEGRTEIQQVVEVDEGQFIKLFTKDLSIWFDLNKSALRVFGALLATVQSTAIGRDLVFFDYEQKATEEFKMSKQTFYRGVDELINKGFIARHKSAGWYFINPAMFFNGNRARFVKEYRIKETKQADLFSALPSPSPL
jgi:Firmicute plasmid replication protein (RepL)